MPLGLKSYRELALERGTRYIGTIEDAGRPNRGRTVDRWNKGAGVPVGSYWCGSFVHGCFEEVGLELPGFASVWRIHEWAKGLGEIVTRPFRGDLALYSWDQPYQHIGFVEKVLGLGPLLYLQTIEGNTSSGNAGSQDNGGGVFRRRRTVRRSQVEFVRVDGYPRQAA